jgi:hypothetical protein
MCIPKQPHKFSLRRITKLWFWKGFFICRFFGHKENAFAYEWCDRCSLSKEEWQ